MGVCGNKGNAQKVQNVLSEGLNYILQGTGNFSFRMHIIAATGVGFASGVSHSGGKAIVQHVEREVVEWNLVRSRGE